MTNKMIDNRVKKLRKLNDRIKAIQHRITQIPLTYRHNGEKGIQMKKYSRAAVARQQES